MSATNPWYIITGAPSAGKSTIIDELARRGFATIEEQGKKLIDNEMAKGKTLEQINVDSAEFELAWTQWQVAREKEANPIQVTFLDRGRLDTLAYFAYYGWPIPAEINQLCADARYKKVFLLELLDYDASYFRVESAETARAMQELFGKGYENAGYEVIRIPAVTINERINTILQSI